MTKLISAFMNLFLNVFAMAFFVGAFFSHRAGGDWEFSAFLSIMCLLVAGIKTDD